MARSGKTHPGAPITATTGLATATVAALVCIAAPAMAGSCILPVEGEEPLSRVEADQPYRLAWDPITLPGYKGLLVRPLNRPNTNRFYEIAGQGYRRVPTPAAGSTFLDSEPLPVRGGGSFLFGWDGRIVWHLAKGADRWQDFQPGRPWWGFAHDEGSQDLYVSFGWQTPLQIWNGTSFVPAGPLPTVHDGATATLSANALPAAIRTLPQAGGTFAIARDLRDEDLRSLWFRPFNGRWMQVADNRALDALAPGLRYPGPFRDADVSEDGHTVRLFAGQPGEASVLLRKTATGWTLDSAAPYQSWVTHTASGIRLAWIGETRQDLTEPVLLFFSRPVEPNPPVLHALDPDTLMPRAISDAVPYASVTNESAVYLPRISAPPGLDPLLVRAADEWFAFDGEGLTALPSLRADRVGALATIDPIGPLTLVQSERGVWTLDDTLTAQPVPGFPILKRGTTAPEIAHIAEAGLFVVVSRGHQGVFVSTDFTRFQPVAAPVPISSLAAPLPDRPGLLLVGSDGLYTFEADCP